MSWSRNVQGFVMGAKGKRSEMMRQLSCAATTDIPNREDLEQLVVEIQKELRGRLQAFDVKRQDNGIVLLGRVGTYYAKQLAQHAVMRATVLPIVANEIEVS
jgi:hypothetical protein